MVYTGTYGNLQYHNQDIFLYEQDGQEWIQAPLYFWKVLHNSIDNEAVAFIGTNDPHEPSPPIPFCEVQLKKTNKKKHARYI